MTGSSGRSSIPEALDMTTLVPLREAKRRSNPVLLHDSGLLREACHRARRSRDPMTGHDGRLRAPAELLNRIKLICPVHSPLQKYSGFRLTQIKSISFVVPPHTGAYRDRHGRG